MINSNRLKLAVAHQTGPQQQGEIVLERFEAWGRFLLLCNVCVLWHLLPHEARFIHENLLRLLPPFVLMAWRRAGYAAVASSSVLLTSPERLTL